MATLKDMATFTTVDKVVIVLAVTCAVGTLVHAYPAFTAMILSMVV